MKKLLLFLVLVFCISFDIFSQNNTQRSRLNEGEVTQVTSKNVYVKFQTTRGLSVGDTIILSTGNSLWSKALIVEMVSSKSCITKSISSREIKVGLKVAYFEPVILKEDKIVESPIVAEVKKEEPKLKPEPIDTTQKKTVFEIPKQTFNGRISVSTNGSFEEQEKKYNRIRTTINFNINNIKGGKFSFENYFIYNRSFSPDQVQTNFGDDFKIYSLSLNYDANAKNSFAIGRRINNRIANMGAIDGLQAEHRFKNIIVGGFVGFRPDDINYGLNSVLLQYGGFVSHELEKPTGSIQTSFAVVEQKFAAMTDRRFVYLQHTNSLLKNLSLFYSLELDLYQNINNVITNDINLTSTYVSVLYRPFKKLSLTTSYDNRKNVIYYETYRTYVDQLINQETRQGIRLNMNYAVLKYVNLNVSGFYRYQESRPEPTKNYVANLSVAQILGIGSSLNLNFNAMNTYYFSGNIYEVRLTKDLFKSTISTDVNYRKVAYNFTNADQPALNQNVMGLSVNYYGKKNTSFMLTYEGTFEPAKTYNRYYLTLSQRFRSKK
jgi:hypothetical protein